MKGDESLQLIQNWINSGQAVRDENNEISLVNSHAFYKDEETQKYESQRIGTDGELKRLSEHAYLSVKTIRPMEDFVNSSEFQGGISARSGNPDTYRSNIESYKSN
jgi:hypothetical protein